MNKVSISDRIHQNLEFINGTQRSVILVACCESVTTACQWLGDADMHMYAKCDRNVPCGSKVMNIFTNW